MTQPDRQQDTVETPDWSAIPMDPADAFDAISNERRRLAILSLARASGTVSASDLAVEIAAIEHGIPPEHITGQQRTTVYIALTQTHLDTLADLGAVEYDTRSKDVTATTATESLAEQIRRIQSACYEPVPDGERDA